MLSKPTLSQSSCQYDGPGDLLLTALYCHTLDSIVVKVQEHVSHVERKNKTFSQFERIAQNFLRVESPLRLIYNGPGTAQSMACNLLYVSSA
jgi:hypothetical protein